MSKESRRKYSDAQLEAAIRSSFNWNEVARSLGLTKSHRFMQERAILLGFDQSHFTGAAWDRSKVTNWNSSFSISLKDILVVNSSYTHTSNLRKKLQSAGMLPKFCQGEGCGITEWLGRPAPLSLDHINGINNDNRLENLRILCYNCHGLTDTYAGKNSKGVAAGSYTANYCKCGKQIHHKSKQCRDCFTSKRKNKPS